MFGTDCVEEHIAEMNAMEEKDGLKQALDVNEMNWAIFQESVAAGRARAISSVRRYCRLMKPKSLRQQAYMLKNVLSESGILARKCTWVTVGLLLFRSGDETRMLYKSYEDFASGERAATSGRPGSLNDMQIARLVEKVRQHVVEKTPMTKMDITLYISATWQIQVSKRWVSRLVQGHPELVMAKALPIESKRAEVSREELAAFYTNLREQLADAKPELVFNMDEVGFSRRARLKCFTCVATRDYEGKIIESLQTDDTDTTFTMIATVALDGSWLPPLVISPCKTLPREFLERHLWLGHDCFIEHSSSGFANRDLVSVWYDDVFLPRLLERRTILGNMEEKAILLCDGFRGHDNLTFRAKAARDNVLLIFLPAHSSHKTQPLDQYVFANVKRCYGKADDSAAALDRNGRKIEKMVKAFYRGTDPFTVRASWAAVGIKALHDHRGVFAGIEVDGATVSAKHVDILGERAKTKRVPLSTTNRGELELAGQGICACCRGPLRASERSCPVESQERLVTRIHFFIGSGEPDVTDRASDQHLDFPKS